MFGLPLKESATLERLRRAHAGELLALVEESRPGLQPWMPWIDQLRGIEDAQEFIDSAALLHAENEAVTAGIWENGRLAGAIGFHEIDWRNRAAQIGYWLGRPFEGRGLATLAARAFVDYAFAELKLNRIEIRCAADNRRSRSVPERLGFTLEGMLRRAERLDAVYADHAVYGMLAEEWDAKRPPF
ncbi:GNAT family N-acetyltransferase [Saccharibacillus sp. CPCC 101409]|uniref:GNAT family N-acetyltransferase n=1 Tax=Saccharibacillus sp. CPCC 101409 TaxID=3058041 RepID=UPI002673ECFA|nr:GNAT family N-acetyltransferase [Saccharibacillus sp. CPCC 101409]MDO3410166.1 GNAT family N-acetyltransferase [Saccharibacillus sp. CPCC 101409]